MPVIIETSNAADLEEALPKGLLKPLDTGEVEI